MKEEDVAYTVSKMTGIPIVKIEEKESEKLIRMEEELHQRIIAQDEAVKVVSKAIRRSRAGLKNCQKADRFILLPRPNRSWQNRARQSACRVSF